MGEVFAGRYELADPIGRGGVGAVWRAWDHRRRRYVAAKVLQQRDAHSLLRFVREQALRIDHPHVLAPASWAADDDKVLFTMDLVAGGSLVHLVGDYGPLPPAFVCTLLDQLLSGLAAVHAEGVIHRDIKPANVLLEATGTGRPRLRLSDFGIAMRLGEPRLTETNLVVGTPGYLAPEQMLGAEPDFPADLFAAGLVALYLLQGAKPDAKALVQYFAEHGTPGPPKGIPEPLWQVVATLLQPDPDTRFRTATGARKALAAAAELLPEPEPDDELIEIFDQLGPLPPGFAPEGPLKRASGVALELVEGTDPTPSPDAAADPGAGSLPDPSDTGSFRLPPPQDPPSQGWPPQDPPSQSRPPQDPPLQNPAPEEPPSQDPPSQDPLPQDPLPQDPLPQGPPPPVPYPQQAPPPSSELGRHRAGPLPQAMDPSPYPPYAQPHVRQPPSPAQPPLHQPYFSPPAHDPRIDASTASYTAHDTQRPHPAQPLPGPPGQGRRGHRAGRNRRAGPPAKVAVPMLLLALACYAVGFWALTRV